MKIKQPEPEFGRVFLYNRNEDGEIVGHIFTDKGKHDQALTEGWKDAPYPDLWGDAPPNSDSIKPWQKAVAARKAKKLAQEEKQNGDSKTVK